MICVIPNVSYPKPPKLNIVDSEAAVSAKNGSFSHSQGHFKEEEEVEGHG